MDIDAKLAAYRSRKKKEQQLEKTKKVLYDVATLQFIHKSGPKSEPTMSTDENAEYFETTESEREVETQTEDPIGKKSFQRLMRVNYFLYFLLWISLFILAVEFEFGIVFVTLSMLFFIWFNTRTGPRKSGEVSAYSVFNPNCEAIDGTINAEQFERELRYGAISVH
ncbi:hypothetical protein J437_LFUL009338 [Ladona fulva]|uniref:SAYSvFN domain-containing protein n=1 Tax=Ladona fulva TaxID=123851 RepID=A0A8K0K5V3_LADFU|nr:hypothetical protein J437_LFUL009338 [Ladona fulva]